MANANQMLATIDDLYAARCRGDKAAVAAFLAPDAIYSLNGGDGALHERGFVEADAVRSIGDLIDRFTFHAIERVDAVTGERKAAVRSRVRVSVPGGEPVETELFDLWSFDEGGKVMRILQFADTALIARMAG